MRTFLAVLMSSLSLALVGCSEAGLAPLAPEPRFTPGATAGAVSFEAWGLECGDATSEPENVFVTGPVLHIRGLHNENPIYSTNPLVNGWVSVVVDLSINTQSGAGRFAGRLELVPEGVNGSWVGTYGGHFRAFGEPRGKFDSHIVARGTGELAGMKLMFDLVVSDALTPPDSPPSGCTFPAPYERWQGVILGA